MGWDLSVNGTRLLQVDYDSVHRLVRRVPCLGAPDLFGEGTGAAERRVCSPDKATQVLDEMRQNRPRVKGAEAQLLDELIVAFALAEESGAAVLIE